MFVAAVGVLLRAGCCGCGCIDAVMPGGTRVVLAVAGHARAGRAVFAGRGRMVVDCRSGRGDRRRAHRRAHRHGVAQQATEDQEEYQDERKTTAHGSNDTGAAKEVPSTQASS